MRGVIRGHQRSSEVMGGSSEALGGTRRHSEALGGTQRYSEALGGISAHLEVALVAVELVERDRNHVP